MRLADLDRLDLLLERRGLLLESFDWLRPLSPEPLKALEHLVSENTRLLDLARNLKDKLSEHLEGLAALLQAQRLYSAPPPPARFIDARE